MASSDTLPINLENPSNLVQDEVLDTQETPQSNAGSNEQKNRGTKRKASIDNQLYNCEVCQVKLNSASQAFQHFQGRSHQGKVKVLEMAAEVPQPTPYALPVAAMSVPTPSIKPRPPKFQTIDEFCPLCDKSFNSKMQADQHYTGKAHNIKLEGGTASGIAMSSPSHVKSFGNGLPPQGNFRNIFSQKTANGSTSENEVSKPDVRLGANVKSELFSCEPCNITLNSQKQLEQHLSGLRHKIVVGQAKPPPPPDPEEPSWQGIRYKKLATVMTTVGPYADPSLATSSTPGGTRLGQYYCKDCDVSVNSPKQLEQHMTSQKHKAKVEGNIIGTNNPRGRGRGWGIGAYRGAQRGSSTGRGRSLPPIASSFVMADQHTATNTNPTQTTSHSPAASSFNPQIGAGRGQWGQQQQYQLPQFHAQIF